MKGVVCQEFVSSRNLRKTFIKYPGPSALLRTFGDGAHLLRARVSHLTMVHCSEKEDPMKTALVTFLMAGLAVSAQGQTTLIPGLGVGNGAFRGPNTLRAPYMVPSIAGVQVISFASNGVSPSQVPFEASSAFAGDETYNRTGGGAPYRLWGIPDGMGGFREASDPAGVMRVLVNHEVGSGGGGIKGHGAAGTTVSVWRVQGNPAAPNFMQVLDAEDLIKQVFLFNTTTSSYQLSTPGVSVPGSGTNSMGRFCSADLAPASGLKFGTFGTDARIFTNGEEVGSSGRAFAHIASGVDAGKTYELPEHLDYSWENMCVSPYPQLKTIAFGADDTTPGNVYWYVGTKRDSGSDIERSGLLGGDTYYISIANTTITNNQAIESSANIFGNGVRRESARFTMHSARALAAANNSNILTMTGAQLQSWADNATNKQFNFQRPEDICWDLRDKNTCYMLTTTSSRLWKFTFDNIETPELGGTVTLLWDGLNSAATLSGGFFPAALGVDSVTNATAMDNMGITPSGLIYIQEDNGGSSRIGRTWRYDTKTDSATEVAYNNVNFFKAGGSTFLTQDEETSGIFDARDIMAPGWHLLCMQAHYGIAANGLSEGAQLLAMFDPASVQLCETDIGGTGGASVPDGILDNNDFIVFIDFFFNNDARADIGAEGGANGSDGLFDNNDFIVYVNRFFNACGWIN
jgi:hypothetical protein